MYMVVASSNCDSFTIMLGYISINIFFLRRVGPLKAEHVVGMLTRFTFFFFKLVFFNHHKNSVIQPMSRYISSYSQIFNFIPILQSRCSQVFDNSCHFFSMLLISLFWLNLDSPYLFRKVIKSLTPEFSLLVSFFGPVRTCHCNSIF